ncbi:ImmA/IrrE family metallo-endopeptidase [Desulfosporosinus sp. FKB]|uniref:ImmA/IrrE family metallo-endopeptidase n=1 Tax=Desulfosporosinus sp. FKB TaxID=1969835 RepID=UPI000B4A34D6|nr:ImmA/IrrE family metallo-endopeptidase [Desulfosporosinus sp. FKB]
MQNTSSQSGNESDVGLVLSNSLLIEVEKRGISIEEHCFKTKKLKGLYVDNVIILNPANIKNSAERRCVLCEELGHYETTDGNILDLSDIRNRKQEKRARNWAYEKLIPLQSIVEASKEGVCNRYELAEFLDVTEDFLDEAIKHYREKYGLYSEWESFIIYFDPLGVLETYN